MFLGRETRRDPDVNAHFHLYYQCSPHRTSQRDFQKKKNLILKFICKCKLILKTEKLILRSIWKCTSPRIAQTTLRKNKVRERTGLGFEAYHKATVTQIVCKGWKDRRIGKRSQ